MSIDVEPRVIGSSTLPVCVFFFCDVERRVIDSRSLPVCRVVGGGIYIYIEWCVGGDAYIVSRTLPVCVLRGGREGMCVCVCVCVCVWAGEGGGRRGRGGRGSWWRRGEKEGKRKEGKRAEERGLPGAARAHTHTHSHTHTAVLNSRLYPGHDAP
jgi:hypothetical protein